MQRNSLNKRRGLFCFLLVLLFVGSLDAAIDCKRLSKKESKFLKKGDKYYRAGKTAKAIDFYDKVDIRGKWIEKVTLQNMSHLYWTEKQPDKSYVAYSLWADKDSASFQVEDRFRYAELLARNRQYTPGGAWLSSVPGFENKAKSYSNGHSLNMMVSDSAQWLISVLQINPGYKVFAPVVHDSTLIFNSNRPTVLQKQIKMKSDGDGTTLWQVPMKNIKKFSEIEFKRYVDSLFFIQKQYEAKSRKLAGVYEGADVTSLDQRLFFMSELKKFMTKKKSDAPVGSDIPVTFKPGGCAVDGSNNVFFTGLLPDKKGDKQWGIISGTYVDGYIVNLQRQNLGIQAGDEVSDPAVNAASTLMVFSLKKEKGQSKDLYYCRRDNKSQQWSEMKPLISVNTDAGDEINPSITKDGYLYFSTNGRPGMGGFDVYRISVANALAGNDSVEHLSYPINSPANDYSWSQNEKTKEMYFTSDRLYGQDNIFACVYSPKSEVIGLVQSEKGRKPVEGATVFALVYKKMPDFAYDAKTGKIYNKKTGKVYDGKDYIYDKQSDCVYDITSGRVYVFKTDKNGKYNLKIPSNGDVIVRSVITSYDSISKVKINDVSKVFGVNVHAKGEVVNAPENLFLHNVKVGTTWELKKIYYAFNSSDLDQSSKIELDTIARIMKEVPQINVELSSYADPRGTKSYNLWLSERRAEKAVAYIVAHGVENLRIKAKGYGATNFVTAEHSAESLQRLNRRTEIKITGFSKKKTPEEAIEEFDFTKFQDGDVIDMKDLPEGFFDKK